MLNPKRRAIWDKSGGKCWYCGCDLSEKGWHADHIEPVKRKLDGSGMEHPERDTEENRVPACASCNLLKRSMPLESFRRIVSGFVVSLNRDSVQYKTAKRYGLVKETEHEVMFWFERMNG